MKNTALIIPAGGIGKSLGEETPKQYIEMPGVPIIIGRKTSSILMH